MRILARSVTPGNLFQSEKYRLGLGVLDAVGAAGEVRAAAAELAAGALEFRAQLIEDVFQDELEDFNHAKTDLPSVKLFGALKRGPASRMCAAVARGVHVVLNSAMKAELKVSEDDLAAAEAEIQNRDTNATQSVPDEIDGVTSIKKVPGFNRADPLGCLSPADRTAVERASDILGCAADPNDFTQHRLHDPWLWEKPNGSAGWADVLTDPRERPKIGGLHLLFARCVAASRSFHEAMDDVFAGVAGATVLHATMKKWARAEGKVKDKDEYGGRTNPWSHLKDLLRVTVRCATVSVVVEAFARLTKSYSVVVVKNRLRETTHDVVAVVNFQDVLVEVQLHLGVVLDIKALSHAAYNVSRAYAGPLLSLRAQDLISYSDDITITAAEGPDGVRVNFLHFAGGDGASIDF